MLGVPIMTSDTKYYYEKLILFELLRSEKMSLNVQKKKSKIVQSTQGREFQNSFKNSYTNMKHLPHRERQRTQPPDTFPGSCRHQQ